jgi:tetratricopeptide (TPR) repeat protein
MHVKIRMVATAGLAAGLLLGGIGRMAEARNANCSGGILYVSQALQARQNKDLPEADKLMHRAVDRLSQCATEDPEDYEALGYLGWAYAEIDSFRPAGVYFAKAIEGLGKKGDKKKVDWATTNRGSFVVNQLNQGIGKIREAQGIYDMSKPPTNDAEKVQAAEALKRSDEAIVRLQNALLLTGPGDTLAISALKNMAFAYMMSGRSDEAAAAYRRAQQIAPNDPDIKAALLAMRNDSAMRVLEKGGDPNKAIEILQQLAKEDPNNPSRYGAWGDALFERARTSKDEAKAKADYKAAGDQYAKAFSLSPKEAPLAFNAGISYQNAREYALAEPMWKASTQLSPDNVQGLGNYAVCLIQLKRYDDAAKVVQPALEKSAKDAEFHRLLAIAYATAGNTDKASQERFVFKALHDGKEVPDGATVAKAAPAATGAGKAFAANGAPDQVYEWDAESQKVRSWFYWSKKSAYHFSGNTLAIESNWSAVDFKPAK